MEEREKNKSGRSGIKKYRNLAAVLAAVLLITGVNLLARACTPFVDWYRLHVFPLWTGTLGRISSLFPFSVGEVLIVTGIACVIPGAAACLTRFRRSYLRFLCWVLLCVYATETLNCYVLYHATTVEEEYYGGTGEYGQQELIDAYTQVVRQANRLAHSLPRDADGTALYDGEDMSASCHAAMAALGEEYPYLSGYYPKPKPVRASHFMSQQYLLGIYFPFTMEANYNTVMYPVNRPATMCHELSHTKGIILEDEANFFGFLACIRSDEPYLQYSGYLSVLGYLAAQVKKSVPQETRETLESPDDLVRHDDVFLTQDAWERVEEKSVLPTETVNKATDVFLEKNLTVNGVADGMASYSRVVRLVIDYYSSASA